MAITQNEILNLVVSMFNGAPGAANLASLEGYVATQSEDYTLAELADALASSTLYTSQYAMLDNAGRAEALAAQFGLDKNMFGLYDTAEEQTAYNFFKEQLDLGVSTQALQVAAIQFLGETAIADQFPTAAATLANKVAVATYYSVDKGLSAGTMAELQAVLAEVDSTEASVTTANETIDAMTSTTTEPLYLTVGTDVLSGTAAADEFIADLNQTTSTGSVANTLATGDRLDGNGGIDTLTAQLTTQQVSSLDNVVDVQPRTSEIEIVRIEAQDYTYNNAVGTLDGNSFDNAYLDAKNMTDIQKIGSYYSDGDLVIENLTTLTAAGDIRHTSAMTITMDHTDSFNSDEDASDLTVYFDEDYLNTTTSQSGSTLTINMINSLNLAVADGSSLIEGFETVTFSVGTDLITVNVAGKELTEVKGLIEAALATAGYSDITVSTYTEPAYFATNIYYEQTGTTYKAGDYAGTYTAFLLTNTGSEELTEGGFTIIDGQNDGSLAYSQDDNEATTSTNPISINVELEKVGRDGEGGNLIIGAKDQNLDGDTDVDQNDGIQVFNITVLGDVNKPSNLGVIQSTNDELEIVTVASETRTDNSYASLTVNGDPFIANSSNTNDTRPFGGTLTTFDADAFMGDLYIGQDVRALNIDTFTATGGGDVTLYEEIGTTGETSTENDGQGFASLDSNDFSITTAAGSDTIDVIVDSGAQLAITTGAGDDSIDVFLDGDDDSGSTLTKVVIDSSSGNNTVVVDSGDSVHFADITLGAGADTVTGNDVNITVSTGSGNDTIYTNNTATKAVIINAVGDNAYDGVATSVAGTTGAPATPAQSELLYGRSVVVTLATEGITADEFVQGYESISVDIEASNGYLTTTTDLHNAIATAINTDPVLSKLASASVDSNGTLTVTYKIDGAVIVDTDAALEYTITGDWADLNTTEQNAMLSQLEEQYTNSDLVLANLGTAYDTAAITTAQTILDNGTGTDGTDSADGDNNTVNAGLGDDVIVLSSDDAATDTIEIDANGFGNDVVVHFEVGATGDVLDFAHLNNVTSLSGSTVSQIDITGTVSTAAAIDANSVVQVALTDLTDNDAGATSAMTFDTLTNSGVLNEINAAADFGIAATPTGFVGNLVNSVFMIEDDANAGFYKVFEVVYNTSTSAFTEATLVGTLDFEASVTLTDENIA